MASARRARLSTTTGTTDSRIVIVSASVGAGHDGAAVELRRRLAGLGHWVDLVDYVDLMPGRLGRLLRDLYVLELRTAPRSWGWLLRRLEHSHGSGRIVMHAAGWLGARPLRRILAAGGRPPAAIVSTYPLASQLIGGMRRRHELDCPALTYLTDLSVHSLWVAEGVDRHLALHQVSAAQARRHGAIGVTVTAPAVRPQFSQAERFVGRTEARRRWGLPIGPPLTLVMAGSLAVGQVEQTARDIVAGGAAVPVVTCAADRGLRARLHAVPGVVALGWVDDVAGLMSAVDVVGQNAGGLSSLEAIVHRLPVISYRPLPGHGEANAAALRDAELAELAESPGQLTTLLSRAVRGAVTARTGRLGVVTPESVIDAVARQLGPGVVPRSSSVHEPAGA